MPSLRKRGKYYHIIYTEQGKQHETTTRKTNRKEAEQVLIVFQNKINSEKDKEIWIYDHQTRLNLSGALTKFIEDRKRSKRISNATVNSYTNAINRFIAAVGDTDINLIDKKAEQVFLNKLYDDKVSENTIANYTTHLRSLFAWLIEKDYLAQTEIPIKKKHFIYDRPTPIKPDHLKLIKNYLLDRWMILQYNFVMATYYLALRKNEAINMSYENIDLENRKYFVHNFKGKRKEFIPILNDAYEFFKALKRLNEGQIFLYKKDGGKKFWSTMMTELNLDYTFHNLRAARGTDLANAGAKPLFLQKFMRHQSLQTTQQHYIELDEDIMAKHLNELQLP